ncbi:MAG: hypothetical protein V4655_09065 [Bdellovibrionota bacterium]
MKSSKASRQTFLSSACLSVFILTLGCGKKEGNKGTEIVVENDEAVLATRLDQTQTPVPFSPAESDDLNLSLLDSFIATQVAALTPPVINGLPVQANDLAVSGTSVYIGYNSAGDLYSGGVDVLDISNILSLSLHSSLPLPGYDINGIERRGDNLYIVGASQDTEKAFLSKIQLNGSLLTSNITEYSLPSYAGTDIVSSSTSLYTTSGDDGALTVFDLATMTATKSTPIADARAVGLTTAGAPIVLAGQPGNVSLASTAGDLTHNFPLGGSATAQSKSALKVGDKWSVASLGEGGFTVFCNANGSEIAHVPAITLPGIDPSRTVTNAVTSYGGLIYTANGEAGVNVYALRDLASLNSCGAGKVEFLGTLNMGEGSSPNGIYSNGLFLYVATGLGGVKILTTIFTTLSPLSIKL